MRPSAARRRPERARKSWFFAGSKHGADRAAVMATLIQTARLKTSILRLSCPPFWSASTITPSTGIDKLLRWNWAAEMERRKLAA
jgi:transposase